MENLVKKFITDNRQLMKDHNLKEIQIRSTLAAIEVLLILNKSITFDKNYWGKIIEDLEELGADVDIDDNYDLSGIEWGFTTF